jgi:hypothetical protein
MLADLHRESDEYWNRFESRPQEERNEMIARWTAKTR